MFSTRKKPRNRKLKARTRKSEHLLDVRVRAHKAAEQRNTAIVSWGVRFLLFGLVVFGAVYGTREGLRRFVWENPDYQVADISVATTGILTRDEILDATGIKVGENIFRVNLSRARQRLEGIPQVETAEIERALPNHIEIKVLERKPIAWLAGKFSEDPSGSESSLLIDSKGVTMKPIRIDPQYFHLPVICGINPEDYVPGKPVPTAEVRSALNLIRLNAENVRFHVRAIDLTKGYCMMVTDHSHAQITFGIDDIEAQLARLEQVLDYVEQNQREIQTVNLMVERNVPITFAPLAGSEPPDGAVTTSGTSATPETANGKTVRKAEPVGKSAKSDSKPDSKSASKSESKADKSIPKAKPVEKKSSEPKEMPVRKAEPAVRRAIPVNPIPASQRNTRHG